MYWTISQSSNPLTVTIDEHAPFSSGGVGLDSLFQTIAGRLDSPAVVQLDVSKVKSFDTSILLDAWKKHIEPFKSKIERLDIQGVSWTMRMASPFVAKALGVPVTMR
jgi:hypothetical protein